MLLLPLTALLLLLPPPLPPVRSHTRRYVQLAPGSGRADDRLERAGSVADQLLSPSLPPFFLWGKAASPPSWVCGLPIFPSATSSAVAMSLFFCGSEVAKNWL